jgi:hypothetical protein
MSSMKLVVVAAVLVIPVGSVLYAMRDGRRARELRQREEAERQARYAAQRRAEDERRKKEEAKRAKEEAERRAIYEKKRREDEEQRRKLALVQEAERRRLAKLAEEQRRRTAAQEAEQQKIIQEAVALTAAFKVLPATAKLRNKVLVVWGSTKTRHYLTSYLPTARQAGLLDRDVSIVVVMRQTSVKVKEYTLSRPGMPGRVGRFGGFDTVLGYRTDTVVRVVDWPTKTLVAEATIRGYDPPSTIMRRTRNGVVIDRSAEYGNSTLPVTNWITSQVR